MNKENPIETTFEKDVQNVFDTTSGFDFLVQVAIMTDSFTNSLVATAQLRNRTGCEHPNTYFNAQRDLAEKIFNCLTHEQFARLRAGVMKKLYEEKLKYKKKEKE